MTAPHVDLSTDRAWLDGFRRGEDRALERVFRVYAPYVLSILRRGARLADGRVAPPVIDSDEQQDLLHDVFVECFAERTRMSYDGLRPFAPYVAQIARFRLYDRVRVLARTPPVAPAPLDEVWSPEDPLPDDISASNEERARVQAFVSTLAPDDRALIAARFEEALSERDAAVRLGSSRQQIRTRERKIRERFRAFIAAYAKRPTQEAQESEGERKTASTMKETP